MILAGGLGVGGEGRRANSCAASTACGAGVGRVQILRNAASWRRRAAVWAARRARSRILWNQQLLYPRGRGTPAVAPPRTPTRRHRPPAWVRASPGHAGRGADPATTRCPHGARRTRRRAVLGAVGADTPTITSRHSRSCVAVACRAAARWCTRRRPTRTRSRHRSRSRVGSTGRARRARPRSCVGSVDGDRPGRGPEEPLERRARSRWSTAPAGTSIGSTSATFGDSCRMYGGKIAEANRSILAAVIDPRVRLDLHAARGGRDLPRPGGSRCRPPWRLDRRHRRHWSACASR